MIKTAQYREFEEGFIKEAVATGCDELFLRGYIAEADDMVETWKTAFDKLAEDSHDPQYRTKLANELLYFNMKFPELVKQADVQDALKNMFGNMTNKMGIGGEGGINSQLGGFFAKPENKDLISSLIAGGGGGGLIGLLLGVLTGHPMVGMMLGGLGGAGLSAGVQQNWFKNLFDKPTGETPAGATSEASTASTNPDGMQANLAPGDKPGVPQPSKPTVGTDDMASQLAPADGSTGAPSPTVTGKPIGAPPTTTSSGWQITDGAPQQAPPVPTAAEKTQMGVDAMQPYKPVGPSVYEQMSGQQNHGAPTPPGPSIVQHGQKTRDLNRDLMLLQRDQIRAQANAPGPIERIRNSATQFDNSVNAHTKDLENTLREVPGAIADSARQVPGAIQGAAKSMWQTAAPVAQKIINTAGNVASQVGNKVTGIQDSLGNKLQGVFGAKPIQGADQPVVKVK